MDEGLTTKERDELAKANAKATRAAIQFFKQDQAEVMRKSPYPTQADQVKHIYDIMNGCNMSVKPTEIWFRPCDVMPRKRHCLPCPYKRPLR